MPCNVIHLPGGGSAIVCSRGQRPKRCSVAGCRRPGEFLCDHPKVGGKTCSAAICAHHAKAVGEETHLCPAHVDAPRPYRPSNGTEGDLFQAAWCAKCRKDNPAKGQICRILALSQAFRIEEPLYPKEWVIDAQGPRCTAFADKAAKATRADRAYEEWKRQRR